MICSMTGFARRETQGPWGHLSCELRTVNHRFLELSLRLPEDLKPIETALRQQVAAALKRGKVDGGLYLKTAAGVNSPLELNTALLQQLCTRLTDIQTQCAQHALIAAPLNTLELLRWPGVLQETERDTAPLLQAATALLTETLLELNAMRTREGARLHELLVQRCAAIDTQVDIIKAHLPVVATQLRERLQARLATLNTEANPERIEQEIVLYAHKMDVEEELDRLRSHLTEVRSTLDSTEPAGRRLDFLMQELNREANTLSSKSQAANTTHAAVDLKVIIEQMREQVQNIE